MIFVTVGTHTSGFDRLVRAVDAWAALNDEHVVVQVGTSSVEPAHCEWFRFAPPAQIERLMAEARVVVTHAGAGSLLAAIQAGRTVVAVPRLTAHGEHIDDHQIELCEALGEAGLVRTAIDIADLPTALRSDAAPTKASDAARRAMVAAVAATLTEWAGPA